MAKKLPYEESFIGKKAKAVADVQTTGVIYERKHTPDHRDIIVNKGKVKPQKFKKGDDIYITYSRKYHSNGDIVYQLSDGQIINFPGGKGVPSKFYFPGYRDAWHGGSSDSKKVEDWGKKEEAAASSTSNEKVSDSVSGTSTDENATPPIDPKMIEAGQRAFNRAVLESGNYVRGVDAYGRETFLRDKDGNLIQEKTNWQRYGDGADTIHDSKYGGNITKFMKEIKGIHGMPYQFLDYTDLPKGQGKVGRVYKREILNNVPLLLLTPGVPKFMDDFDEDTKGDVLRAMGSKGSDVVLDQMIGDESGMYYTFEYKWSEYYDYVNTILNAMANLLGIGSMEYDGQPLQTFKWQKFANQVTSGIMSSHQSVPFYIDAESQATESFNNSTTESKLSQSVNTVSDVSKELQFVLGGAGSAKFKELINEKIDGVLTGLGNTLNQFNKIIPTRIVNKLLGGFGTLVTGGKIVFPEIWAESEFSRGQEVKMRFNSPSGDPYSIYINVLVPLIHLVCLCAPRQMGPNGYQSPYIVRAWYKGIFSTDMGIIESLNITRGDKGRWNKDGLPLTVEVTVSIKDLYKLLSITKRDGALGTDLIQNSLLLGYISTLCGVNSYKPDILRTYDLYKTAIANIPSDFINGIFDRTMEGLTNAFANFGTEGSFSEFTSAGIASLINNFRYNNKLDDKNLTEEEKEKYKDMFKGVSRPDGVSDEEYAQLVYGELTKHSAKTSLESALSNPNKVIKDYEALAKKYDYKEPLKVKSKEDIAKSSGLKDSALDKAYKDYLNATFSNYGAKLNEAKRKYEAEKMDRIANPDKWLQIDREKREAEQKRKKENAQTGERITKDINSRKSVVDNKYNLVVKEYGSNKEILNKINSVKSDISKGKTLGDLRDIDKNINEIDNMIYNYRKNNIPKEKGKVSNRISNMKKTAVKKNRDFAVKALTRVERDLYNAKTVEQISSLNNALNDLDKVLK